MQQHKLSWQQLLYSVCLQQRLQMQEMAYVRQLHILKDPCQQGNHPDVGGVDKHHFGMG
jgi:hypothetical protein